MKTSRTIPDQKEEVIKRLVSSRDEIKRLCRKWKDNGTYRDCLESLDLCVIYLAIMLTDDESEEKVVSLLRGCGFKGKIF